MRYYISLRGFINYAEVMFTVSIPLSCHIYALVTGNRIFISWYFDGHKINFSKIMCWIMLRNGPILVVMTKEILCCIVFMEISSKMWLLGNSAVILQLNNVRAVMQGWAHWSFLGLHCVICPYCILWDVICNFFWIIMRVKDGNPHCYLLCKALTLKFGRFMIFIKGSVVTSKHIC